MILLFWTLLASTRGSVGASFTVLGSVGATAAVRDSVGATTP